jgi:hypothetical protein
MSFSDALPSAPIVPAVSLAYAEPEAFLAAAIKAQDISAAFPRGPPTIV